MGWLETCRYWVPIARNIPENPLFYSSFNNLLLYLTQALLFTMVAGKTSLLLVATCLLLCCFASARAEVAHGRQLTQSDCDDCACAEVSCAELCGSANSIDSFTCDEVSFNSVSARLLALQPFKTSI
jgi:hypothetical protein